MWVTDSVQAGNEVSSQFKFSDKLFWQFRNYRTNMQEIEWKKDTDGAN